MKTAVLLFLLLHEAAAVTHSLRYFYAASSGIRNFPKFVAVSQVDGAEMVRYDSNTKTAKPRQDWMDIITAEDPDYWQTQTRNLNAAQPVNIDNIKTLRQRFNQTEGVHMFQVMYGCEWDDKTGDIDGFKQYAFDGKDLLSFDLKTLSFVACKAQAVPTKNRFNSYRAELEDFKNYLTYECVGWLKKYLKAANSSLLRTELPSMWFLQRTPSSVITCFATGFFPERALLLWKKEGQALVENGDVDGVLPNHDGTFQISTDLRMPEDAKDHHKYECVFQFSGVKGDKVYKLDASAIKTNFRNSYTIIIIASIAIILLLACVILAAMVVVLKKQQTALQRTNSIL